MKKWLKSRCIHYWRRGFNNFSNHGYPITLDIILKWIDDRIKYYNNLTLYFKDNPSLILLDIDDPNWIEFISKLFNLKKKDIPSLNITKIDSDYYTKKFKKFKNKNLIVPDSYLELIKKVINKAFEIRNITNDLNIHNIEYLKKIYLNNFYNTILYSNFESAKKFVDMKIKHNNEVLPI